jgi:hypothetical protein
LAPPPWPGPAAGAQGPRHRPTQAPAAAPARPLPSPCRAPPAGSARRPPHGLWRGQAKGREKNFPRGAVSPGEALFGRSQSAFGGGCLWNCSQAPKILVLAASAPYSEVGANRLGAKPVRLGSYIAICGPSLWEGGKASCRGAFSRRPGGPGGQGPALPQWVPPFGAPAAAQADRRQPKRPCGSLIGPATPRRPAAAKEPRRPRGPPAPRGPPRGPREAARGPGRAQGVAKGS